MIRLIKRLFKQRHNWQVRARNYWGMANYIVCLKCGLSEGIILKDNGPVWTSCERIKVLDDQFDSKGNYIFKSGYKPL